MSCIMGAKFTMTATHLRQGYSYEEPVDDNLQGSWTDSQDPLTGEIVREWTPVRRAVSPTVSEDISTIKCVARGYSSNNRFSSNQQFGENYQDIDTVRMWVPAEAKVYKGDRITNIKDVEGNILWLDEEHLSSPKATTFNVIGVTPVLGPFNRHIESFLQLERSETSG